MFIPFFWALHCFEPQLLTAHISFSLNFFQQNASLFPYSLTPRAFLWNPEPPQQRG